MGKMRLLLIDSDLLYRVHFKAGLTVYTKQCLRRTNQIHHLYFTRIAYEWSLLQLAVVPKSQQLFIVLVTCVFIKRTVIVNRCFMAALHMHIRQTTTTTE